MGCGCTGGACGGGKGGMIMMVIAGTVAAGVIGTSVFGFGRDDTKQDAPKPVQPAAPDSKPAETKPEEKKSEEAKPVERANPYVLGYTMKDIDGKDQDLAQYKGKVILIVNVASECGFTKQYEGLEKLYEARKDKGFVILGFPANNFGGQEPGKDADIKAFCTSKFAVTFPMFSKISVIGKDAHPLYQQLAANSGEPEWNFNKYLVDKDGNVVQRYQSRVKPDDAALASKIEELLAK